MSEQNLRFTLTAVTANFTQKFQEAGNQVRSFSEGVTSSLKGIRDQIGNVGNIVAAMGLIKLTTMVDEATMVHARLKDVTGSAEAAGVAKTNLYASAQRLRVGYSELAGSVAKMLPAVQEMGGGVGHATKLAEILVITAKQSGASTQEAASGAQQFGQALQSGVLAGDELKSIMENNGALARAMAKGLGVGVGELRRLGEQGKLTSDVVANALTGQYDQISAKADELPVTVGGAWVQVTNAFQDFVTELNSGTGAFSFVADMLGVVARVIETVAKLFRDTGSEADKLGANKSVVTWGQTVGAIFVTVIDLGRAVWEVVAGVGRAIGGLAAATTLAMSGELTAAGNVMKGVWDDAAASVERVQNLLTGGEGSALLAYATGGGGGGGGGVVGGDSALKGGGGGKGGKKAKDKAEESQVPAIQAEMEAERLKYMQSHQLREMSKLEELQAMEQIAARYDLKGKDKARIARDIAKLEIAALKEMAETGLKLDEEERTSREQKALRSVELAQQEAQSLAQLGVITQAQLLEQERLFEEQRTQIKMDALAARLALADPDRDPVARAQILSQMEALESAHQLKVGQLAAQSAQQSPLLSLIKDTEQAFGQSIGKMLSNTQSLRQGMNSIWQAISANVTGQIGKMLAAKVAAYAKERLLSLAGIGAKAGEAGAGAAAAVAPIPIVGPALALGALASVFAAVIGLQGSIPSAAAGWSIPSGVNPVTQLHEREMVLPAQHADVIRSMADGGGAQRGGGGPNIIVQAMDARSVVQALRSGGALHEALAGLHRDFVKV